MDIFFSLSISDCKWQTHGTYGMIWYGIASKNKTCIAHGAVVAVER